MDAALAACVQALIQQHPTFGYRRLWALLRYLDGLVIIRKAVYRALQRLGWLVRRRQVTPRPRVQGWRSPATMSNTRWAIDVTHIPVGVDGWAHLAAVIPDVRREYCVVRGYRPDAQWQGSGRPSDAESD